MKKYFFLILFFIIFINCFASDFFISGINELKFIYRNADDLLHQFMEDEFKFDLSYNNFRFGMKYIAKLPKFDKFGPDDELNAHDILSEWDERYFEFESDNFYIRGGIFDAAFGSGIVLNAYKNTELDEDNRLEGCKTSASFEKFTISGIYGIGENEKYPEKNDLVSGLNIEINPNDLFKIGFSGLNERFYVNGSDYEYCKKDIFGSRIEYVNDKFDLNGEYAVSEKYRDVTEDVSGNALYGNLNVYFDKFTFTTVYKKYENFNDRFNEVPTANYSEQTIATYGYHSSSGFEEEGVQGIIRFNPNSENEFIINYAEGWSKHKDVRQSDFHTEWIHFFENSALTLQYSQLERFDDKTYYPTFYWSKEVKPEISYDFTYDDMPILLKAECKTTTEDDYGERTTEYEPTLQADISFGDYSISISGTHKFHNYDDFFENNSKIGVEIVATIWEHSDIKLFVGSEKGGQVCRNGVCMNQAEFDGVRLNISTRF